MGIWYMQIVAAEVTSSQLLSKLPLEAQVVIITIIIIVVLYLINLGFIEEIKLIPPSIKFRERKKEKTQIKSEYTVFKSGNPPFNFGNMKWQAEKGEWHLYKEKLVGKSGGLALIENVELGRDDFLLEVTFSVNSDANEINIQICGSELAFRENRYGLVYPEEEVHSRFETGGIDKGRIQTIAVRKSGNVIHVYFDGYFLFFNLLPVEDHKNDFIGIRTYKGEITLYKTKHQKRPPCGGFLGDKEVFDRKPEISINDINKWALTNSLKEVRNDLHAYLTIANKRPENALKGLYSQFNNVVYNLVYLFKIDASSEDSTAVQWIKLYHGSIITEHQFNLGKEIENLAKKTHYGTKASAQACVKDVVDLLRELIKEYQKLVVPVMK